MLEFNYSKSLKELLENVHWDVKLPSDLVKFFAANGGIAQTFVGDKRLNQRISVRTKALLWVEKSVPFCERQAGPIGIYTCDLSRSSIGFLTSIQFFPSEQVRIVFPDFWMRVKVTRVRRRDKCCYETGARLINKHSPSAEALRDSTQLVCG